MVQGEIIFIMEMLVADVMQAEDGKGADLRLHQDTGAWPGRAISKDRLLPNRPESDSIPACKSGRKSSKARRLRRAAGPAIPMAPVRSCSVSRKQAAMARTPL